MRDELQTQKQVAIEKMEVRKNRKVNKLPLNFKKTISQMVELFK